MAEPNDETRHRIMASNRGKNTGPEIEVRRALFHQGFRFRLHYRNLPGTPDIIFPSRRAVIFIHGCFWHGHNCKRKPHSKSNISYWKDKIARNIERDKRSQEDLFVQGWRVLIIWECAIRRVVPEFSSSCNFEKVIEWLNGNCRYASLSETGLDENLVSCGSNQNVS
jgi:DNA mismatch endonuclease (patch repair protein)